MSAKLGHPTDFLAGGCPALGSLLTSARSPTIPFVANETDAIDEATSEIDAELVVFRVFRVGYTYKDRPVRDSWGWEGARGPGAEDRTTVTVGDLTPEFVAAMRALGAWRPFVLNSMFGGHYSGRSSEELEQVFQDLMPDEEAAVADYVKDGHTYITVTLRRPVRVLASVERTHRWLRDLTLLDDIPAFMDQAGEYLDVTGVGLMRPLGTQLGSYIAVYRANRPLLFAPGKTPHVTDIQLHAGSVGIVQANDGWASRDWTPVSDALTRPTVATDIPLLKSASRWLWAATAEADDRLRAFQFAFFGLEILANKLGKSHERALVDRLSDSLGGAPLKELFWPSPRDSDSPWRNLVFRFTVVALYFSPDTASDDVVLFKRLASARNDLSHGTAGDEAIHELPASEATQLLRRYLQHAAEPDSEE